MPPKVDKDWFQQAIKAAGFRSQRSFADAVQLDAPKVTNVLIGKRRLQAPEIHKWAEALRRTPAEIEAALGFSTDAPRRNIKYIAGYVGASGEVVLYEQLDAHEALEEVEIPFLDYGGSCLVIRGDSMSPRYADGEVIGCWYDRDDPTPLKKLIGVEVVAKATDGRMVLKVLQRGTREGSWSLLSLNPFTPPILDVELEWAEPVDFHIPHRAYPTLR